MSTQGPGAPFRPAEERRVPQTRPVPVGDPAFQEWMVRSAFHGLADVGGQAAPALPGGPSTDPKGDSDAGAPAPVPTGDPSAELKMSGESRGPGAAFRPPRERRVPQTRPVPVGEPEFQEWRARAAFRGLADVGGQAAPALPSGPSTDDGRSA